MANALMGEFFSRIKGVEWFGTGLRLPLFCYVNVVPNSCFSLVGKGLGRDENGTVKPIKSNLKFDKAGIGYNEKVSQESQNRWWEQMYNEAASKIDSRRKKRKNNSETEDIQKAFNNLTDEELFAACGGRTAHKAARHGLKLNGKLERIKTQEARLAAASTTQRSEEMAEVSVAANSKKVRKVKTDFEDDEEFDREIIRCPSENLCAENLEISSEISRSKKEGGSRQAEADEDGKNYIDSSGKSVAGPDCDTFKPTKKLKKRKKSKRNFAGED